MVLNVCQGDGTFETKMIHLIRASLIKPTW